MEGGNYKYEWNVGMSCNGCSNAITRILEKEPCNIINKLIRNSFFRLSIVFQLINIHIGIKSTLREIKKREIPSTVISILPQLRLAGLISQT